MAIILKIFESIIAFIVDIINSIFSPKTYEPNQYTYHRGPVISIKPQQQPRETTSIKKLQEEEEKLEEKIKTLETQGFNTVFLKIGLEAVKSLHQELEKKAIFDMHADTAAIIASYVNTFLEGFIKMTRTLVTRYSLDRDSILSKIRELNRETARALSTSACQPYNEANIERTLSPLLATVPSTRLQYSITLGIENVYNRLKREKPYCSNVIAWYIYSLATLLTTHTR